MFFCKIGGGTSFKRINYNVSRRTWCAEVTSLEYGFRKFPSKRCFRLFRNKSKIRQGYVYEIGIFPLTIFVLVSQAML